MKKLFLILLLAAYCLPFTAYAQVSTYTPNLHLDKPCVGGDPGCAPGGDPGWGPKINSNFDILDVVRPSRVTTSTLPGVPAPNQIVVVTDALDGTTCTTGGGTSNNTCQWNGSTWVVVGGGAVAVGGGGQPADNDLTAIAALTGTGVARRTGVDTWALSDPTASPCGVGSAPRGLNANLTPFGCTAYQLLDPDLTIYAGITPSANTQTLLGSANFAAWRTNLSLVPGTDIQAFNQNLADIAGLAPTNNRLVGSNGSNFIAYTVPTGACDPLRYDPATHTFSCASYPSATVSGTTGNVAIFTGTNSVGNSSITEDADSTNFSKKIELGTVTNSVTIAAAGGSISGARVYTPNTNADGDLVISTGTKTSGRCVEFDASGRIVQAAAPCASGGRKAFQVELFGPTDDVTTGNGKFYFRVPTTLNGLNLVAIDTNHVTAGTTGVTSVQITRCAAVATSPLCSGTTASMLSTVASIDSGETSTTTAATAAVINTANDDVATGQILRFDVTAVTTTAPKGLIVNLEFQ